MSSYYGTYAVRAGYKDTTDSMSAAATYTYKEKNYKLTVSPTSKTFFVGDSISSSLYDGSIVKVYTDNVDITSYAKISNIKITDKYGNVVSTISSGSANTYKITYTVTHGNYTGTCSNTIIIEEKEIITTPTPVVTPKPTQEPTTAPTITPTPKPTPEPTTVPTPTTEPIQQENENNNNESDT